MNVCFKKRPDEAMKFIVKFQLSTLWWVLQDLTLIKGITIQLFQSWTNLTFPNWSWVYQGNSPNLLLSSLSLSENSDPLELLSNGNAHCNEQREQSHVIRVTDQRMILRSITRLSLTVFIILWIFLTTSNYLNFGSGQDFKKRKVQIQVLNYNSLWPSKTNSISTNSESRKFLSIQF